MPSDVRVHMWYYDFKKETPEQLATRINTYLKNSKRTVKKFNLAYGLIIAETVDCGIKNSAKVRIFSYDFKKDTISGIQSQINRYLLFVKYHKLKKVHIDYNIVILEMVRVVPAKLVGIAKRRHEQKLKTGSGKTECDNFKMMGKSGHKAKTLYPDVYMPSKKKKIYIKSKDKI